MTYNRVIIQDIGNTRMDAFHKCARIGDQCNGIYHSDDKFYVYSNADDGLFVPNTDHRQVTLTHKRYSQTAALELCQQNGDKCKAIYLHDQKQNGHPKQKPEYWVVSSDNTKSTINQNETCNKNHKRPGTTCHIDQTRTTQKTKPFCKQIIPENLKKGEECTLFSPDVRIPSIFKDCAHEKNTDEFKKCIQFHRIDVDPAYNTFWDNI